ncbi:hypothetical protein BU15DRAFT_75349 [Melanogaster broomeanus]|nr:hypothetical protein BU15DRAFT_75349 [Melanogaster broomeanus]
MTDITRARDRLELLESLNNTTTQKSSHDKDTDFENWGAHHLANTFDPEGKWTVGTVDLHDWPVHSDTTCDALDEMKSSYGSYDMYDHLINVASYQQQLQGAMVEIHFYLFHYMFKGTDTYTADIQSVHILKPPQHAALPKKHPLPSIFTPPSTQHQVT